MESSNCIDLTACDPSDAIPVSGVQVNPVVVDPDCPDEELVARQDMTIKCPQTIRELAEFVIYDVNMKAQANNLEIRLTWDRLGYITTKLYSAARIIAMQYGGVEMVSKIMVKTGQKCYCLPSEMGTILGATLVCREQFTPDDPCCHCKSDDQLPWNLKSIEYLRAKASCCDGIPQAYGYQANELCFDCTPTEDAELLVIHQSRNLLVHFCSEKCDLIPNECTCGCAKRQSGDFVGSIPRFLADLMVRSVVDDIFASPSSAFTQTQRLIRQATIEKPKTTSTPQLSLNYTPF